MVVKFMQGRRQVKKCGVDTRGDWRARVARAYNWVWWQSPQWGPRPGHGVRRGE